MLIDFNNRNKLVVMDEGIEITSPEQFVPIFLAQTSPRIHEHSHTIFGISTTTLNRHTGDREILKKELVEQLNHPYPKRYSLPIPVGNYINDDYNHSNGTIRSNSGICYQNFLGDITDAGKMLIDGTYTLFGLCGNIMFTNGYVGAATEYFNHNYIIKEAQITQYFHTKVLVVVKAKHIPYIRARLFLKLPFNLPLNSMKILVTSMSYNVLEHVKPIITRFCEQQGIQPTYMSEQELRTYLFAPASTKSKVDTIRDAALFVEHPEMETAVNI